MLKINLTGHNEILTACWNAAYVRVDTVKRKPKIWLKIWCPMCCYCEKPWTTSKSGPCRRSFGHGRHAQKGLWGSGMFLFIFFFLTMKEVFLLHVTATSIYMPIRCLKWWDQPQTRMSKTMSQNKPFLFVSYCLRFFCTVLESWIIQWASGLWAPWFLQSKRDVEEGEPHRKEGCNVIKVNLY